MLWAISATARATVPPPPACRDIAVNVVPAPVDASHIAMRWAPRRTDYKLLGARLVAEDGTGITLDIITDPKFAFLLKPQSVVAPGAYHVEYSDTCGDAPASRNVVFSSAPPIAETPALLEVSTEASNCTLPWPPPSQGGRVPIQTVTIPLDDTLNPYLPFLRVTLTTRAGSVGETSLGEVVAPSGGPLAFKFLHKCWQGPTIAVLPVVPRGQNDLTATGALADGVVAFVKKTAVDFNCGHCDAATGSADADVVVDGGATESSGNGGIDVSAPGASADGCSVSTRSRQPAASLTAWITTFATIAFARRRREWRASLSGQKKARTRRT
jgi:hypothetical protein